MTKLLTWTLHAPSSSQFSSYYKLADGEPWYSKNYQLVDKNGMSTWDYRKRSFIEMIEKYPHKFYAIGLHQFGVNQQGRVYNMGFGTHAFDKYVLNNYNYEETESTPIIEAKIELPVETSLRYLMHNYPQIKWSLQFLCTTNSVGNRVEPVLDNVNKAQDKFIDDVYHTMRLYLEAGFTNIKGVEIDFEKTTSRPNDEKKFRDLLVRVKNAVCIPLGLELRVNMFAMTGDLTPSYYAWHDYATIASGRDKNGNQAVDEFQLMTYDFSWGGSAPGPSTPLWWLENVLKHVKDLENRGIWKTNKVFIGNAGYGRRWPLGENRYGVTLDYKQLMLAQNGTYIHNPGEETTHNGEYAFWFNDHDFIPISGFNDDESDYQKTYIGVYDRFRLGKNDGARFDNMNRPPAGNYVTNYSRKQFPIFSGVAGYDFNGISNKDKNGEVDASDRYIKNEITEAVTDTLYVAGRTTGLDLSSVKTGYSTQPSKGGISVNGKVDYTINATGSYRLVALVFYPFFDKADIPFTLNGTPYNISGNDEEWYPFMQAQEKHFVDLGTFNFSGENKITVGVTAGAQIWGFVAVSNFDYNLRGGEITFPTNCQPMKRRNTVQNETVSLKNAQYPSVMRIVGETLTRPPRPAIIWEDIFSSYENPEKPEEGVPVTKGFPYYTQAPEGFSVNDWVATKGGEADYDYAYNDSRGKSSQLVLNKKFGSNIAVDVELRGHKDDSTMTYGIRLLATEKSPNSGYVCELNYSEGKVKVVYETPGSGGIPTSETIYSKDMSPALLKMNGQRIKLKAYIIGNKLSFWVEKNPYFDRVTIPYNPGSGAYGVYNLMGRLKVYKYNVSSLDRYERMERIEIITGGKTYYFDEVERDLTQDGYDKYGFIKFSGYPAEIADQIGTPGGEDGATIDPNGNTGTILDTQHDVNYEWSNDYKNKFLAAVPAWQGRQDVKIRFRDAGIWFRNFYVGDNEGMSVAYNSDRIGFIRTANMVNDYGCKGIALWTLGQEDPTIYSYISG